MAADLDAAVEHLRAHLRAVFEDVALIHAARPELFSDASDPRPTRRSVASWAGPGR